MKKLNITKEQFEKSRYFTKKYGKLEYVSESGNVYKTDKGKVLKFAEERDDGFSEADKRCAELCYEKGTEVSNAMYLVQQFNDKIMEITGYPFIDKETLDNLAADLDLEIEDAQADYCYLFGDPKHLFRERPTENDSST